MQHFKTILIIIVFFLLGSNIATVMVYQKHIDRDRNVLRHRLELPDNRIGRYINRELDLNDEQINQFRQFRRKYNRTANGILGDMEDIRSGMLDIFKSTTPDKKEYEKLAADLGAKHIELKELTFDYYANMLSVLDESQKQKMSEVFEAMLTIEGFAKTPNHEDKECRSNAEEPVKSKKTQKVEKDEFEEFRQ